MAKKVIFLMLSLVLSARFALPVQAADFVALPQNVRHSAVPCTSFQNHSTSLSFEALETKISDVFKPEKENAKLQATYSGTCGTNVNWNLDTSTGKLTISGTGAMKEYSNSADVPWYAYKEVIKTISIESGITYINDTAISFCSSLTTITVAANNQNYKSDAGVLFNKSGTTLIQCPPKKSGSYVIPSSVTSLRYYAFLPVMI